MMTTRSRDIVRSCLYSPAVTVKIGKEEKAFVLSRELLCRQSAYFEKAFGASSSFKESKSRICVLSDIPVGIFRIFSAWVYGSGLCYIGENNGNAMKDDDFEMFAGQASEIRAFARLLHHRDLREKKDPSAPSNLTTTCAPLDPDRPTTWPWALLVNLYIFGDRFDTKQLRVDVIDWMMTKAEGSSEDLTFLTVTHAFDNTPASSPLRSFLVHHMAYNCVFDNRRNDIATLPIELLVRVLEINT